MDDDDEETDPSLFVLGLQAQVSKQDLPDGCISHAAYRSTTWYGPWVDVPLEDVTNGVKEELQLRRRDGPSDVMVHLGSEVSAKKKGELVTVSGLLPGTRYRFRHKTRTGIEWDQCPVSEEVQTRGKMCVCASVFVCVSVCGTSVCVGSAG